MSRSKRDGAGWAYDQFRNNPAANRLGLIERMYLRMFTEIACARFKWTNLPETVDARFLELTLFNQALSIFYDDRRYGLLSLRGTSHGQMNMYDNPTQFTVMGNTFVNKTLAAKECVPIWANFLRVPDLDIALVYATKLAEAERTIEINMDAMRRPFIIGVTDENRLSLANAYRQVREGQPVVMVTQSLSQSMEDSMKLLDMKIDKEVVLNLQVAKSKMWNECMTFLGINNANTEKRERLVVSEVEANNSSVLMARNVALDARRAAVEQINAKFDLNIAVDWNVDVELVAAEKELADASSNSGFQG